MDVLTAKYPRLQMEDPTVLALLEKRDAEQETLRQTQVELDLAIETLQQTCSHANCIEQREKARIFETGVLLQKTCVDCGIVLKKPPGSPSKICDKCWEPMKFLGTQPGQGERTHHYKCPKGHEHSET